EAADRVAKAATTGQGLGEDQPVGDPDFLITLVVQDLAGQVRAMKGPVQPQGQQLGHRLARCGVSRGMTPEEESSGLDESTRRDLEFSVQAGTLGVNLVPPEADHSD